MRRRPPLQAHKRRQLLVAILGFLVSSSLCAGVAKAASLPAGLLGVAVQTGKKICLSIDATNLPRHTKVMLADTADTAIAQAEVAGNGKGCPGVKSSGFTGYRLRLVHGDVENNVVLTAVVGRASVTLQDGRVMADLRQDGHLMPLRSCTSADGVHLTAWDGTSTSAKRLWHLYYYLNQDLEQTCTNPETAE